jgi:Ase1/PRC1/MAP65 family protein
MSAIVEDTKPNDNTVANVNDEHTKIANAISSAEKELHQLWDVVGLGNDDRGRILSELYENINGVISTVLEEEQELCEQYKTRIAEAVAEVADLSSQLGEQKIVDGQLEHETLTQSVNRLDMDLLSLREKHKNRFDQLETIVNTIKSLSITLGSEIGESFENVGNDLTDTREVALNEHLKQLEDEVSNRLSARSKLVKEMKDLMFELVMECDSEIDQAVMDGGDGIGLTIADLNALSNRSAELQQLKIEREAKITELAGEINGLWEKLNVPDTERAEFFSQHHGVGIKEIAACEEELERLKKIKMEQLKPLVNEAREKIKELWEELHFSEAQQMTFQDMTIVEEKMTEETLDSHEAYIENLEERAEQMRPIMKNINKREKIINDRNELEDRERRGSGAGRLNSRGRDAFKRLQEEEKIRARAKKLLPKVNKELAMALKQWEERYGTPLTYDGENYHSRMLRQRKEYADKKEEDKQRKEKEKAEKKKASIAKKSENNFNSSHSKSRNGASSKRRTSHAVLSQKNAKH